MKTVVDGAMRAEVAQFRLRYACEHCAHFDVDRRSCAEGYPNVGHRDARVESVDALEFCKSFELV